MKNNVKEAIECLENEMTMDENWRNYWRDTFASLAHEHSLNENDMEYLFNAMNEMLNH